MVKQGVTQICLDVGKVIVEQFLQHEVTKLCRIKYQRNPENVNYRHGNEQGYGYIAGQ